MARCQQTACGFKSSVIHSNGEVVLLSIAGLTRTGKLGASHIRGARASAVAQAPMLEDGPSRALTAGCSDCAQAFVGEADGMRMRCAG